MVVLAAAADQVLLQLGILTNMPQYRSTNDIFKTNGEEVTQSSWLTGENKIHTPKTDKWDYKRELVVEDIEIWEALYEDSWGLGIYAAYRPYAEFYMIKYTNITGVDVLDTFYGAGSQDKIIKFMVENNIPFQLQKVWVDDDDAWLFEPPETKTIIT